MERVPPLSEINRTRARASRGNFNYARRCRRRGTQTVSRLKASEARTVFKDSLSPLMEPLGLCSGGAGETRLPRLQPWGSDARAHQSKHLVGIKIPAHFGFWLRSSVYGWNCEVIHGNLSDCFKPARIPATKHLLVLTARSDLYNSPH